MKLLLRILNNGISVNNTLTLNRRIRVANLITILIAAIMALYTPVFFVFEQPVGIFINCIYFFSAVIAFCLIHQRLTFPAFMLIVGSSLFYFIATSIVYGTNVNLHFFLLIVCMTSVALFNSRITIRILLAFAIIAFFSLIVWSHFYDRLIYIPKQSLTAETAIGQVNLLLLFLISCTFMMFFKNEMLAGHKIITDQKNLLEVRNKDVIDSINYALRIQQAMLPGRSSIKQVFPGYFLFFQPKDIVSGDFYWIHETEKYQFIAVGDCTGHGVPGCMMSVLGINLLIEIVENRRITDPEFILSELRNGILLAFDKDGNSTEYKDGMDISLIRINKKSNSYTFSGAQNPVYHMRAEKIDILSPDKQPVGFHHSMDFFTKQECTYESGDILVLFTDGFADQFGGVKNKKFGYKKFQELIFNNRERDLEKVLTKTFFEWKGELEQIDDICVLGIRL
jgi:sigma-B regulation protein RsbU (phosphoserine phosphatase)